jgi:c-di-GMP-binding flagellar brake protein YcgR
MKEKEKGTEPHYGTVNFGKRNHPSFNVDLPIEYSRTDLFVKHGRAVNASEGGLLLCLPEKMEIGQHLSLKLFFTSDFELDAIETFVEVSWRDIHLGEGEGDYRTGVRFVDISPENLNKLKNFLRNLSG